MALLLERLAFEGRFDRFCLVALCCLNWINRESVDDVYIRWGQYSMEFDGVTDLGY